MASRQLTEESSHYPLLEGRVGKKPGSGQGRVVPSCSPAPQRVNQAQKGRRGQREHRICRGRRSMLGPKGYRAAFGTVMNYVDNDNGT
jgi:hypothetical protein